MLKYWKFTNTHLVSSGQSKDTFLHCNSVLKSTSTNIPEVSLLVEKADSETVPCPLLSRVPEPLPCTGRLHLSVGGSSAECLTATFWDTDWHFVRQQSAVSYFNLCQCGWKIYLHTAGIPFQFVMIHYTAPASPRARAFVSVMTRIPKLSSPIAQTKYQKEKKNYY